MDLKYDKLLSSFAFNFKVRRYNLALVTACLAAYSRASLATRLGVDEHAPPREFAAALWTQLRGRGGGGGGGGGGKGRRTTAPEESSA